MSDVKYEGGSGGCEEDDKCCKCFPIACGMKFLAIMSILGGVFGVGGTALGVMSGTQRVLGGILLIAAYVPVLLAALFGLKLLMNSEDKENREAWVKGSKLMLLTQIAIAGLMLVAGLGIVAVDFGQGAASSNAWSLLPGCAINIALQFYYVKVAERYAGQI